MAGRVESDHYLMASRSRKLVVAARHELGCERRKADAEVVEVGGIGRGFEEFVYEGQEVVQRSDGREGRCSGGIRDRVFLSAPSIMSQPQAGWPLLSEVGGAALRGATGPPRW